MASKRETEKQLNRALDALDRICAVFADEQFSYPEKVGRCVVTATMALDYCGRPEWSEEFTRIYAERDRNSSISYPKPLLKVA